MHLVRVFLLPTRQLLASLSFRMSKSAVMFSLNLNKNVTGTKNLLTVTVSPLDIQKREKMDSNQTVTISMENPVADYKRLSKEMTNADLNEDEKIKTYKALASEARKTVWKLLFEGEQPPTAENEKKAAELLKEHKLDACYFVPWDYNDWIIEVRDEILKREMFDFWHNFLVKNELGPCWARDSDYFDDMEDEEPAKFYCHAGAVAPWPSDELDKSPTTETDITQPATPVSNKSITSDFKISWENPLEEYKKLVEVNLSKNNALSDDEAESMWSAVAECARKTVWDLLFDCPQPSSAERQVKAGDLLREHKTDAGFYAPWVYNQWIVKLREEVLKRKLTDFWRNQMVKRELGLCWARDSDYFDDMEDPEPAKFYEFENCKASWLNEDAENEANEHKTGDGK